MPCASANGGEPNVIEGLDGTRVRDDIDMCPQVIHSGDDSFRLQSVPVHSAAQLICELRYLLLTQHCMEVRKG